MNKSYVIKLLFLLFSFVLLLNSVFAINVNLCNSKDWSDVYSLLLRSALDDQRAQFMNSESITSISRIMSPDNPITLYSSKKPFISNLGSQLRSAGFKVSDEKILSDFSVELDPGADTYYVVSYDNPRITLSLAPLAIKNNAWVFIVSPENVDAVVSKLKNAKTVISVGNFRRDVFKKINPFITKSINNNDLFRDSRDIAKMFGPTKNIVLADGGFIESEFFSKKMPVLLSGHNKILDDTYDFLVKNNVKTVIIVGNELAVVGEQIRSKSNKKISVFIKFGTSGDVATGKVYALTMFPLPLPKIGLTVDKVIFDPKTSDLIVYYHNLGSTGIYLLTTLSVKDNDVELASASDADVIFLGSKEVLPVRYSVDLLAKDVTPSTTVEFYTSYGLYPSGLDNFLTMTNKYGPPFSINLVVKDIGDDSSELNILDVFYNKGLKRVGVVVNASGNPNIYYSVKIRDIVVNGLTKDLSKDGVVKEGVSTIFIPVELDPVDLSENTKFNVQLYYGKNKDMLFKKVLVDNDWPVFDFKVISGNILTGFVAGLGGSGSVIALVVIILIIAGIFAYAFILKKK